ncbi:hypothetical protein D3C77_565400 [compost metagenome]
MIEVAGEKASAVQHVVAAITNLDGGGSFRKRDKVQEAEHIRTAGLGLSQSSHGFLRAKKCPRLGGLRELEAKKNRSRRLSYFRMAQAIP